jgi:LuxR family maltose regulon positive regulatory protein
MTDSIGITPASAAGRSLLSAVTLEDWDATADLIDRDWADLMTTDAELLKAVLRALPARLVQERPRLALATNYVTYLPVDGQTRTEIFRASAPTGAPGSVLDVLAELTSRAASARSKGEFEHSAQYADSARAALADATDDDIHSMQGALAELHYQWGLAFDFSGRSDDAVREYTESYDRAVMVGNLPIQTQASGGVAFAFAICGRRDEAERWLTRVPKAIDVDWSSRAHVQALLATTLLALRDLDETAAAAAFARLGPITEKPEFWANRLYVQALATRGVTECTALLAEIDVAVAARPAAMGATGVSGALVTLARAELHLRRGTLARGRAAVEDVVAGNWYTEASARLLRARGAVLAGDHSAALVHLDGFTDLAAPHPVISAEALVLEAVVGPVDAAGSFDVAHQYRVYSALATLSDQHVAQFIAPLVSDREILDRVIVAASANVAVRIEPLTAQELVVLTALAEEGSVRGAAEKLYLSLNTVKSHLRRVYLKLDVNSKEQAIALATNYGLIST